MNPLPLAVRTHCPYCAYQCGIIAGDPKAYSYLPNSLTKFPPAEPLKRMMIEAGYKNVYYKLMGLGVMAVHVGTV